MTDHDPVNSPAHYTSSPSGVECIQVTEHLGFCIGNAIKYLWRVDDKGDALENLRKARWYVDREIARREHAKPQMAYGDTEQEARKAADVLVEDNDRAVELGKKYAEDIISGAERIFNADAPRDLPMPPIEAKDETDGGQP